MVTGNARHLRLKGVKCDGVVVEGEKDNGVVVDGVKYDGVAKGIKKIVAGGHCPPERSRQ